MNFEELAIKVQQGDDYSFDLLMNHYEKKLQYFVVNKSYYIRGYDKDDLVQIARIGLFKACMDFNDSLGVPFGAFAWFMIRRNLSIEVNKSRFQKNRIFNESSSTDEVIENGGDNRDGTVMDLIGMNPSVTQMTDYRYEEPFQYVKTKEIQEEYFEILNNKVPEKFRIICALHYAGNTYKEIEEKTGFSKKQIDNCIQRLKRRLKEYKKELVQ